MTIDISSIEAALQSLDEEEEQNQVEYTKLVVEKETKERGKRAPEWRNSEQKEARRLQAERHRARRKEAKRIEKLEESFKPAYERIEPKERKNTVKIKIKKLVEVPMSEAIREKRAERYFAKADAALMASISEEPIESKEDIQQQEEDFFSKLDQELFQLSEDLQEGSS